MVQILLETRHLILLRGSTISRTLLNALGSAFAQGNARGSVIQLGGFLLDILGLAFSLPHLLAKELLMSSIDNMRPALPDSTPSNLIKVVLKALRLSALALGAFIEALLQTLRQILAHGNLRNGLTGSVSLFRRLLRALLGLFQAIIEAFLTSCAKVPATIPTGAIGLSNLGGNEAVLEWPGGQGVERGRLLHVDLVVAHIAAGTCGLGAHHRGIAAVGSQHRAVLAEIQGCLVEATQRLVQLLVAGYLVLVLLGIGLIGLDLLLLGGGGGLHEPWYVKPTYTRDSTCTGHGSPFSKFFDKKHAASMCILATHHARALKLQPRGFVGSWP